MVSANRQHRWALQAAGCPFLLLESRGRYRVEISSTSFFKFYFIPLISFLFSCMVSINLIKEFSACPSSSST